MTIFPALKILFVGSLTLWLSACSSGSSSGPAPKSSTFSIGGTVSGLSGTLTLVLNPANQNEQKIITGDGDFRFNTSLQTGNSYSVSISDSTDNLECSIDDGDGDGQGKIAAAKIQLAVKCPPLAPELTVALNDIKTFHFSWPQVPNATHYQLREYPDGAGGIQPVKLLDENLTTQTYNQSVPLYARLDADYLLTSCNAVRCTDGQVLSIDLSVQNLDHLVKSIGYLKASNTGKDDHFGTAVSLNADATVLAIGAIEESSDHQGVVNGDNTSPVDNELAPDSGAVYLFTKDANRNEWQQMAFVKASNASAGDKFGHSVSLNAAGTLLAVGALYESSDHRGIVPGDDTAEVDNEAAADAGAVYLFAQGAASNEWQQVAYVKASNAGEEDQFGAAVKLNAAGTVLAVGANAESSDYQGVLNGDDASAVDNEKAIYSGAVYLFAQDVDTKKWQQTAYVKASNTGEEDDFGYALSLNATGTVLAVGARAESGDYQGVLNGEDTSTVDNDKAVYSGAVYLFAQDADTKKWQQSAYVKASNAGEEDQFGYAVTLNAAGTILAVGAVGESSDHQGIVMGDDISAVDNNRGDYSGATYLFAQDVDNKQWQQMAYLKSSNGGEHDQFGYSVSVNEAGTLLAVGSLFEDSADQGAAKAKIGVDNNRAENSGAAYLFAQQLSGEWQQQAYIKASNTGAEDRFGSALSLSGDGQTLAVGAYEEASAARGVGGSASVNDTLRDDPQSNDDFAGAGAVYLY